ncbi:MAG TPA: prolipoprotein diacylglyceryl transferase [Anaerolineales bacterium]
MPSSFTIPGTQIAIHFYGIIIMLGALGAAWLAERNAVRRGLNGELVWDGLIWVLIAGIIGARVWHIAFPQPSMLVRNAATGVLENPYFAGGTVRILDMISIWKGGLGIPGAIIGGAIALYFFSRRYHLNYVTWLDIAAPSVALGQAIGRWGNYFNQELYGKPTTLPWGIQIDNAPGFPPGTRFHPIFLYESVWNLANMALLLWLSRRYPNRLKPGDIFLVYLIIYPIGRFLLEFLRVDAAQVGGININQTIMAAVAIIATAVLVIRHLDKREAVLEENR